VVKKNGLPRREVILSKFTVVSSFEEWSILEVGAGHSFIRKCYKHSIPREDSFSLGCTLFSYRGMAQLGEWSRFSNEGQTFPRVYSFSPSCTLFSVEGMV
jgi:hypothetical protein